MPHTVPASGLSLIGLFPDTCSQSEERGCSEKGCVLPLIILWVVNMLLNTPWIKNLVASLWPYLGLVESSVEKAKWKEIRWLGHVFKGDTETFISPTPQHQRQTGVFKSLCSHHNARTSLNKQRMKLWGKWAFPLVTLTISGILSQQRKVDYTSHNKGVLLTVFPCPECMPCCV